METAAALGVALLLQGLGAAALFDAGATHAGGAPLFSKDTLGPGLLGAALCACAAALCGAAMAGVIP